MKATKGCVNRDCQAFTKKTKYNDKFEYCPLCSQKLEYVCADCWKVLDHSDKKYCEGCKQKREQDRAIKQEKWKKRVTPLVKPLVVPVIPVVVKVAEEAIKVVIKKK